MDLPKDVDDHALTSEDNSLSALYSTDEFRLYCFKVLPCSKRSQHCWQSCVFAHWGEKARRRDIRTHNYSSQLCPDVKRVPGGCPRGDACHMSHNIFESWLHPELYRTQLCTSGSKCNRTVCFFAHSVSELRTATKLPKTDSNAAIASLPAATAGSAASSPLLPLKPQQQKQQPELDQLLLATQQDSCAASTSIAYQQQPQGVAGCQVSPTPSAGLPGAPLMDASPQTLQGLVAGSGQPGAGANTGLLLLQGLHQQQHQPQHLQLMSSSCSLATSPATSLDSATLSWLQQQASPGLGAHASTTACFMPGQVSRGIVGDMLPLQMGTPAGLAAAAATDAFLLPNQQQQAAQLQQQLMLLQHQELQLQQALMLQQQLQGVCLAQQQPVAVGVGVPASSYALVVGHQPYTLM